MSLFYRQASHTRHRTFVSAFWACLELERICSSFLYWLLLALLVLVVLGLLGQDVGKAVRVQEQVGQAGVAVLLLEQVGALTEEYR